MNRAAIKALLPGWALQRYRTLWQKYHNRKMLLSMNPRARRLYELSQLVSYHGIRIDPVSEAVRAQVEVAARSIYGEDWNYYSDALRPEIVAGFVESISACSNHGAIDYLEIGSCQGLSMSLIGLLLKARGQLRSLVSVDPYFEGGYEEGEMGPYRTCRRVQIDKKTRSRAFELYRKVGLTVELLEVTSLDGLKTLISAARTFDLIYIDGFHEQLWPVIDFGLSFALLRPNGVIILDDHLWSDVEPIKELCDRNATKIQETWKTASYRF